MFGKKWYSEVVGDPAGAGNRRDSVRGHIRRGIEDVEGRSADLIRRRPAEWIGGRRSSVRCGLKILCCAGCGLLVEPCRE